MFTVKKQIALFLVELLAVVLLRAVFMYKRDNKDRPVGARVGAVRGRPVFRFPFLSGEKHAELPKYEFKPTPRKGPHGSDQAQAR